MAEIKWPASKIRKTFIDFFTKREHIFWPSSSVIPHNDDTLLFANAGMNQFKQVAPTSPLFGLKRAVNSQKCIRAGGKHNDLEDAGKDTYHHTFFEMLGNWSFGDYSKKEAIDFAWSLLTDKNQFALEKSRLYVTYYSSTDPSLPETDEETKNLWLRHLDPSRVLPFGAAENFWEMGESGPCGPCTEIHYDLVGGRDAAQLVNQGLADVVELWNLVFIAFDRHPGEALRRLPKSHVDTGLGFERLAAVLQGRQSNYDTDIFAPLFQAIKEVTGCEQEYCGGAGGRDVAYRVAADHARCLCVAIADGVLPDCVGRGYVLRRILRRAFRVGKHLFPDGKTSCPFLYQLVPTVAKTFQSVFDNIAEHSDHIQKTIFAEESGFLRTLQKGEGHLEKLFVRLEANDRKVVSGVDVFFLYSSIGYPVDLIKEAAADKGFALDLAGFERAKADSRELSKAAQATESQSKAAPTKLSAEEVDFLQRAGVAPTETEAQYKRVDCFEGVLVAAKRRGAEGFLSDGQKVVFGEEAVLVLDRTCFYAESGGQIFDTGDIVSGRGDSAAKRCVFSVSDVQNSGGYVLHVGRMTEGELSVGQTVALHVDYERRGQIAPNHTMTHVLNFALRKVCGAQLEQRGSRVLPEKFSFDFASAALGEKTVESVEAVVRDVIKCDLRVYAEIVNFETATKISGIRAMFGETYPKSVRVISIGMPLSDALKAPEDERLLGHSFELCGGTHLSRTSEAETFCVVSEAGISKGVRRIIALTKAAAAEAMERGEQLLKAYADASALQPEALTAFLKDIGAAETSAKHKIPFAVAKRLGVERAKLFKLLKKMKSGENK